MEGKWLLLFAPPPGEVGGNLVFATPLFRVGSNLLLLFAPPLLGVGGNLVAIQASRVSTYLHFWSLPGVLPYKMRQHWPNPYASFFSSGDTAPHLTVI